MKIDNSLKPTVAPTGGRAKPLQSRDAAGTPTQSDDVKLSSLAGQLQPGEGQPPIDSARVQEIKQAIAEGRFSINAGAIADRLISSARELIDSQRQA